MSQHVILPSLVLLPDITKWFHLSAHRSHSNADLINSASRPLVATGLSVCLSGFSHSFMCPLRVQTSTLTKSMDGVFKSLSFSAALKSTVQFTYTCFEITQKVYFYLFNLQLEVWICRINFDCSQKEPFLTINILERIISRKKWNSIIFIILNFF